MDKPDYNNYKYARNRNDDYKYNHNRNDDYKYKC